MFGPSDGFFNMFLTLLGCKLFQCFVNFEYRTSDFSQCFLLSPALRLTLFRLLYFPPSRWFLLSFISLELPFHNYSRSDTFSVFQLPLLISALLDYLVHWQTIRRTLTHIIVLISQWYSLSRFHPRGKSAPCTTTEPHMLTRWCRKQRER